MRIYLAGGESKPALFKVEKPPYIMYSFAAFWGSSRTRDACMECVKSEWCKDFLLDSGAFTFLAGTKDGKGSIDWHRYMDEYIDFINSHDVKKFFELDIDSVVGLEKVEEFRREIERRTGKQSIPVWHVNRGWNGFKRMCDEYKYVAIGGLAIKEIPKKAHEILPWFIEYAHKTGTRVHGLGFTDLDGVRKYKFDTVDSSSWQSGMYGTIYRYTPRGLTYSKRKAPDGKRVNWKAIDLHNIRVWAQFAKDMDKG